MQQPQIMFSSKKEVNMSTISSKVAYRITDRLDALTIKMTHGKMTQDEKLKEVLSLADLFAKTYLVRNYRAEPLVSRVSRRLDKALKELPSLEMSSIIQPSRDNESKDLVRYSSYVQWLD